ncbi:hypothetical protein PQX77_007842 [Marasmius sp. AFHP31]|nr:hypothetical protein PQX77_007842 [Marasmius sp. AFHP31]
MLRTNPPPSPSSPPVSPRKAEKVKFRFATRESATIQEHLAGSSANDPAEGAERNPWREGDPYRFSPAKHRDPWQECIKLVDKHDDENCRGWKEHIDTLLVFAGLFSAAVTAFIIESYRQLQEDPSEASLRVLEQISNQLSILNNNSSSYLSPGISTKPQPFIPTSSAIRINTCWFLSLTLSLSTALFAILSKQWLQEYRRDAPTASHKDSLGLRHMRFEGFHKWGVPIILSLLPILLQISLVLFFAGILDLLWSLHYVPAAVTTLAVSISVLVLILTTVLPAYYVMTWGFRASSESVFLCPFKSPQSWWFYRLVRTLSDLVQSDPDRPRWYLEASDWASIDFKLFRSHFPGSFNSHTYPVRSLKWICGLFGDNLSTALNIFHCLQELSAEEVAFVIDEKEVRSKDKLNQKFMSSHSWDKDVQLFCAELALRQINTSPSSVDIGTNLWWLTLPGAIDSKTPSPEYEGFLHQTLYAMKLHLIQGNVNSQDVDPLISIARSFWTHPIRSVRESSLTLFEDITIWLSRPITAPTEGPAVQLLRVRKCCTAVLYAIHSTTNDISALASSEHVPPFIRAMNQQLDELDDLIRSSSRPWTRRSWIQTRKIVDYLQRVWPVAYSFPEERFISPSAMRDRTASNDSSISWSALSNRTAVEDGQGEGDECGDLGLGCMRTE